MKNLHRSFLLPVLGAALLLTGCSSSGESTQRYSWPLATASPEDTVTQIFAEKFAASFAAFFAISSGTIPNCESTLHALAYEDLKKLAVEFS